MPVKVDDPRDIQGDYDERFNPNKPNPLESLSSDDIDQGIRDLEDYANDPGNHDPTASLREAENTPSDYSDEESSSWNNNVTGNNQGKKIKFSGSAVKKGGVIGLIIALLLGTAGLISFFGGPGLLLVNLAEVLTEKFNYQLGSLNVRQNKILQSKLNNTTTGSCSPVKIRCKFTTFSDREIENFKKSGLKVETDGKSVLGRNKIKSFEIDGEKILPKDFKNALKNNQKFNTAMKTAYRTKFASMSDKVFKRVSGKLGISKKSTFNEGDTDENRKKAIVEDTKNGRTEIDAHVNCENTSSCSETETKNQESTSKQAQEIEKYAAENDSKASKILSDNNALLNGKNLKLKPKLTNLISIIGPIDDACMVYGWTRTISYISKTARMAQMARYAMIFLTTASMIKAGDARAEDVSYLGDILTKTTTDSEGNTSKSATDSFGYRYAAYGDSGIDSTATLAVAGASFGGTMQATINKVLDVVGGAKGAKSTCKIVNNPFVQGGALVIGLGSFLFGVGEGKAVIQAAAMGAVFMVISAFLPALIGDLIAGRLIDDNTYGEKSGNFITSGTGGILSKVASSGGNSILKRDEAQAYMNVQREAILAYADYERSTTSPFDASNPHTFMGSIYTQLVPYISSGSSTLGKLGSITSLVTSSAKNLISPPTFADANESFNECHDPDYQDLDIATDPFCNPVVGIPPQYLDKDPLTVIDELGSEIDETTGEPADGSKYAEFVKNCIEREDPFGSSKENEEDKTSECFIGNDQQKANYYLHYIDMRANTMGEEDIFGATDQSEDPPLTPVGENGVVSLPDKNGWSAPIKAAPNTGALWHMWLSKGLHKGVDYPAPVGTPVYAAHDGVITDKYDMGSCGWATILKADGLNNIYAGYQHMDPSVERGDTVKRGQVIGAVGRFCGTGTHLHFSIETANRVSTYADGPGTDTSLNPQDWVPMYTPDSRGSNKPV